MPEIHVEGLVRDFGDQRALDHVGFTVADGELFTLLGPSGCGKSTTLMSLAGFQTPNEGRIAIGADTFFDAERRIDVPAEQRNLGIVFQSYAVWPHMTVFENLAFPLKVRKAEAEGDSPNGCARCSSSSRWRRTRSATRTSFPAGSSSESRSRARSSTRRPCCSSTSRSRTSTRSCASERAHG